MQSTSLEAYKQIEKSISGRQKLVYQAIDFLGRANNREIAQHLDIPINEVTPRVNELRTLGLVVLAGKCKDPISHKLTMQWKQGSIWNIKLTGGN